ncbi:Uncharacterized conserved protein YafD, endonuclease/exonuclease/phosphatase (EEP) superfamily [Nonlabens sp. Hel1_33_55]|uniref:endonuclease/exonuclease/phosphatase family protein n=1 Tax=Nonlabens sp. Hel1_33_55 TaxID=1336802 RepID=UPI000875C8A8|nr:endonuclease/exonuclease/phosphatase family protein [Nonlabens sp. Hel1_33_55]SCX96654.1 Uncharacterized conserved protein YafD, endonuclease/exonuclease/phosphatase (EEP) superfamily [Nonlabens sp. Hel1_33_55]
MNWRITFQIIGLIAALLSLVPLFAADFWWIRVFDFPHLQLAAFTLIAIILYFFTFKPRWIKDYLYIGILIGCFAFQMTKIYKFLPISSNEVLASTEGISENKEFTVFTANVLESNESSEKLFKDIQDQNPDIILFTETNSRWLNTISSKIGQDYPYKVEQPQDNTYGMILYSKLPIRNSSINFMVDEGIPSIDAQIQLKDGNWFQLLAIHPTPPMPQHNPKSTDRDTELMRTAIKSYNSDLPVVVLGDFNDVAWSDPTELTKKIGKLLDYRLGRGFYNTFHAQYPIIMRWNLDHILTSSEFRYKNAGTGSDYGSDHFPVFVTLTYEPELAKEQEASEPTENEWKRAKDQMSEKGIESFTELPPAFEELMDN